MAAPLTTPLTKLFGIKHPVLLAGMNVAAGPDLAAAVTNAGGLGVLGGVGYTPKFLKQQIDEIKEALNDKNAPFGIDLLLPQVGGNARKTNKDYTGGQLPELIDIIISEKAALFVCAVGIPPKWAVDKLHAAGIPVANMVGAPKHVAKALSVGADIIIAQGGEGGGHTGDVPTSILIPACADEIAGKKSSLTGEPILLVAAGGIYNGAGLAAALAYGATGVWVGTRFVCAEEAGASRAHQEAVLTSDHNDTIRTIIFTGRPLRVRKTPFVLDWENNRQADIKNLTSKGTIPVGYEDVENRPHLMGSVSAMIKSVEPAKKIVDDMVRDAAKILQRNAGFVNPQAKI
ncbi:2-nitropropane dioxygenase [Meredithblackwellia eburnea MCA 4105]